METNEIYATNSTGRLQIKNSLEFIKLLSGAEKTHYQALFKYAKKVLNKKADDIPHKEQSILIDWAIVKLMIGFDNDSGANLLTYFTYKLDGEISEYRNKRDSMTKKIHKMVNEASSMNEGESHVYVYNQETGQNELDKITEETPETVMLAEDIYYRKLQAFRMAYSGIPKLSQQILNECVSSDYTMEELAAVKNMTKMQLEKIRNNSLSLILSRVLRSNHLTEEEKQEIKEEHGLVEVNKEELLASLK